MAAQFKVGQTVKLNPAPINPSGPVEALQMDSSGNISYLVSWTDANGVVQSRWFPEAELVAA